MNKGKLFVITGPSGAGKDSLIAKMRAKGLKFHFVVTTTSRPPRAGEVEGRDYHFVSREEFQKIIGEGGLLEYAEVYGNYYGSTVKALKNSLADNKVVILQIDPQGAKTIKGKFPETRIIFIAPPTMENLRKRLEKRGKDSPEVIGKRMKAAEQELAEAQKWDRIIVNEENGLNEAAEKTMEYIKNSL